MDPRLDTVLNAAITRVLGTARQSADHVVEMLGLASMSASSNSLRQAFLSAQFDLRYKINTYHQTFATVLQEKVYAEVETPWGRSTSAAFGQPTDWETLSLVGDAEVEERISAHRLGQEVADECELELRELAGYISGLLQLPSADLARNPLRPELIGRALFRAIESVTQQEEVRRVLAKELSRHLAQAMRPCYRSIIDDLRQRGTQPVGMAVRTVQGPGNDLQREAPRENLAYQPRERNHSQAAAALRDIFGLNIPDSLYSTLSPARLDPSTSAQALSPGWRHTEAAHANTATPSTLGGAPRDAAPSAAYSVSQSDAQVLEVIKRLVFLGSGAGALNSLSPTDAASLNQALGHPSGPHDSTRSGLHTTTPSSGSPALEALSGLMAVNLIRAHRDELRRASGGALDHMVIDVVGALFDQVLSDPKVPPQMAQQIARLQLPVLRAAMKDVGFFNTRRHPVRQFVNRIATVAAVYEDYSAQPGEEVLKRVRALVQEVVQGDFDQLGLYESKLQDLEQFITEQTRIDNQRHAQVTQLLGEKEAALRIQQRYTLALQGALAPLPLHEFVREFLGQVWSQVLVSIATQEGPQSELAARMRLVTRDLIFSVQPKGTPALRKEFLLTLPRLMKNLNEGLERIRWSEVAKKKFFAQLLPAHADSLKQTPLSDFASRQVRRQVELVERVPIPGFEEVAQETTPLALPEGTQPMAFSEQEIAQVGLVEEAAIDWEIPVEPTVEDLALEAGADVDINLDSPPPPSKGVALIGHIQAGVPYQMHLNGVWKKVRLNWVSPGRSFFIFTHGRNYTETVSLTARMLLRLCETERFRAFEQSQLIERATVRARKQLAALAHAH